MSFDPLPENIEATYDDGGDELTRLHQEHHDRVHEQVNKVGAGRFPDAAGQPADQVPTTDGQDGYNFTAAVTQQQLDNATRHIGARLYNSTAQTLTSSTVTSLDFDSEVYDTDDLHDTSTNPHLITVDREGRWRVFGQVRFQADADGERNAYIRLNGSTVYTGMGWGNSSVRTLLRVDDILQCSVGDEIELLARQTSGGDLDVDGGIFATTFAAYFLG